MQLGELNAALDSGITVLWQGRHDYERAVGSITGIIKRKGSVFSCELTTKSETTGRNTVIICKPEELFYWKPPDGAKGA